METFGLLAIAILLDIVVLSFLMRRGDSDHKSDWPSSIFTSFFTAMAMFYGTLGIGSSSILFPFLALCLSFLFILICGKLLTAIPFSGVVRIATRFSVYRVLLFALFSLAALYLRYCLLYTSPSPRDRG